MSQEKVILQGLTLDNVGPFKKLNLKFNSQLTVIIGKNGTGKTTILTSIAAIWKKLIVNFGMINDKLPYTHFNELLSRIKLTLSTDENRETKYYFPINHDRWLNTEGKIVDDLITGLDYPKAPLIANASYRKFSSKPSTGPIKEEKYDKNELINRYARKFNSAKEDVQLSFQQWIVNRYFFSREQWGQRYKLELDSFSDNIKELLSKELAISFKTVNPLMEPIFATATGDTPFHQLSSGSQSVCYIIYEIVSALSSFYPDSDNIFLEKALILIDEIEIHLHPDWQQNISNGLIKLFPNCQFIVTTHSPIIISNCQEKELINLILDNGEIKAKSIQSIYGWMAEDIMKQIMGLESSRPAEVENDIAELEDLFIEKLENDNLDNEKSKRLEELSEKLTAMLPESDPLVTLKKLNAIKKIAAKK